ncbi:MAG: hypothetical protein AB1813_21470 [Verrucomicrobiota bacterium]
MILKLNAKTKLGWLVTLGMICLAIAPAIELHAQRSQTRSTRATGGSGLGGGLREYQNNTMVGDAMITSDPETRRLIIITDEETNLHISQVITNLDRPKPQVLIKVVFLEVTHRDDLDLGVEGKYTHRGSSTTNTVGSNFMNLFGVPAQSLGSGGFYKVISDDLELTIRALSVAGKTEVLSRPSILARNNQQATIIVGQELPFITNSRITDQGQTINTIQYQDIGIILRVTPFITSDGLVEMIVSPEISTLTDQTVPISDQVSAPVIAKRAADTVVVTPNGKTVVIGGLMENNKTESDRKVPLLGDIPLLGAAFKRKVKAAAKTELIIFLTPYIVPEPGALAKLTEEEAGRSELAPKAFSEKDLDKFLDGVPMKHAPEPAPKGKKNGASPSRNRR